MITLANRVRTLLGSAGAPVWYFYPQSWVQLPVISWRESGNREFAQADGGEHLAELEYTVDIWSDSPAKNAELASGIDAAMASATIRPICSSRRPATITARRATAAWPTRRATSINEEE